MLSPSGPSVQSGGRISIGAPDSRSARSSTPRRMASCAKLSGPGAIIKSTQWVKKSPSPGFSAGTKIAAGAASRVASWNIRVTAASLSASLPAGGALTSTPINRASWALANATAERARSTASAVGSRKTRISLYAIAPSLCGAARKACFASRQPRASRDCTMRRALVDGRLGPATLGTLERDLDRSDAPGGSDRLLDATRPHSIRRQDGFNMATAREGRPDVQIPDHRVNSMDFDFRKEFGPSRSQADALGAQSSQSPVQARPS